MKYRKETIGSMSTASWDFKISLWQSIKIRIAGDNYINFLHKAFNWIEAHEIKTDEPT